MYLIAGYVRTVAMLFETAPKTKATKAERACGDVPPALFCFPLSIRRFSWSNTVYCREYNNSNLSLVQVLQVKEQYDSISNLSQYSP